MPENIPERPPLLTSPQKPRTSRRSVHEKPPQGAESSPAATPRKLRRPGVRGGVRKEPPPAPPPPPPGPALLPPLPLPPPLLAPVMSLQGASHTAHCHCAECMKRKALVLALPMLHEAIAAIDVTIGRSGRAFLDSVPREIIERRSAAARYESLHPQEVSFLSYAERLDGKPPWGERKLPDSTTSAPPAAFSPTGYGTELQQWLLGLPQHLRPHSTTLQVPQQDFGSTHLRLRQKASSEPPSLSSSPSVRPGISPRLAQTGPPSPSMAAVSLQPGEHVAPPSGGAGDVRKGSSLSDRISSLLHSAEPPEVRDLRPVSSHAASVPSTPREPRRPPSSQVALDAPDGAASSRISTSLGGRRSGAATDRVPSGSGDQSPSRRSASRLSGRGASAEDANGAASARLHAGSQRPPRRLSRSIDLLEQLEEQMPGTLNALRIDPTPERKPPHAMHPAAPYFDPEIPQEQPFADELDFTFRRDEGASGSFFPEFRPACT